MTDNPQQPGVPGPDPQRYGGPQPYGEPTQQPYGEPGQDSRFGTAAYDPGEYGQPLAEPQGLRRLKMLTLVSLGIYVVSGIISFITTGNETILDAQLDAQSGLGIPREQLEASLEAGMVIGMVVAAVSLAIAIVVYLLVYFGLRAKKNWARVLGIVFAILGVLFTLFGLLGLGSLMAVPALGILTIIVTLAFLVVSVLWLVTAFKRDVSTYLQAKA